MFPLIFGTVVYWMVGLRDSFEAYFTFCVILVLVANASVSLGYALSAIFRNTTAAIAAGSVLLMPMALFSGLLLDVENVAPFLWPFSWFSIIKYAYHAIIINEYAGQRIYCGTELTCVFRTGDSVVEYVGAKSSDLSTDIGLLFVFMLVFRIIAYVALSYHSSRAAVA
jgi:hypothetical protein